MKARPAATASIRKSALDEAFRSPIDFNGILLTGQLKKAEGREDLNLRINLESLHLNPANGLHSGEIDVQLLQRDEAGHTFGRVNDTLTMNFHDPTYQKLLGVGVPYQRAIESNPQPQS